MNIFLIKILFSQLFIVVLTILIYGIDNPFKKILEESEYDCDNFFGSILIIQIFLIVIVGIILVWVSEFIRLK